MFWGALGHLTGFNLRWTLIVALGSTAAFVLGHAYWYGRNDAEIFLAYSVLAGALTGWRFFVIQGAWATTAGEQSLLVLAPRWPAPRELKWLVIRTFWSQIPASTMAWLMLAVVGFATEWIPGTVIARGALGLFSTAYALFGFLLVFLAGRRLRKRNRLAMLYLVVIGIAGVLLIPFQKSVTAWGVLCLMLIVPATLALLAFCVRRPQFPVRPDADLVL
jgi:hypothetical protein